MDTHSFDKMIHVLGKNTVANQRPQEIERESPIQFRIEFQSSFYYTDKTDYTQKSTTFLQKWKLAFGLFS